MLKRPAFWVVLGLLSVGAATVAWRYFPDAFSIVALDLTMDRDMALDEARAVMARDHRGPEGYRQAASFALDEEAQTFIELEGGGKAVFTRMLRDGTYAAYTWRVRQFKEGEPNETLIRFTPEGHPYGFVERLKEDAPGAALDGRQALQIGESQAAALWSVEFSRFTLVEQGQERRPGGRVDHTFTYERPSPTLNEGRLRLRLVVSGDRLTEVTHFVRIPEAFTRRYQGMRSANEAIGIGSVVGMMLLYVVGGVGVGLFFMLRRRWVLWRHAAMWGTAVGLAQALAAVNEWPLMWMSYDTALPRATFLAQQIATVVAMFAGFSIFFALSFMAAETLTRRAFGDHPQFWRAWSRGPGSSTAILGRTASGYLLVSVFFAYDVLLYLLATRVFGWWSPSEALLHPDVLATHLPWLSAIANSFQAGFWEECLFRAVPLAGAALIGDRFGQRRLFLVIGFIVQAIVFGAGHAPYPTQPSFARPVELILPSIGFGLLYLYFGLVPGIVLHFTFDVVWFALPIFLAQAPGVWVNQGMVVLMTLVPLWVVLWRRWQAGRWTELAPADRNAAWAPPPATAPAAAPAIRTYVGVGARTRLAWRALGTVSLAACAWAAIAQPHGRALSVQREEAARIARQALEQRGVSVGSQWRVMPMPGDGNADAQQFVAETAGEARRRELLGTYLPQPRWNVRIATFAGDVAERAEEWNVSVAGGGEVRRVQHTLPEGRPGAALDEAAARRIALNAIAERLKVDAGRLREVSARPEKLKARTDWTFTFTDLSVAPLPQGEPRIQVVISGDEVSNIGRFVYIPEEWQRQQRASGTRDLVLQILSGIAFGGLLVAAAVTGVVSWSRRRYTPRLFATAAGLMFAASIVNAVNGWPTIMASLQTALPLQLQLIGLIGIGLVGLTLTSSLVGLAIGALPHRLARSGEIEEQDALRLGVALGVFGAAASIGAVALKTPAWAQIPNVAEFGSVFPVLDVALDPVTGYLTRMAIVVSLLAFIDLLTAGWTRRRALALIGLVLVGALAAGAPAGSHPWGWAAAAVLLAAALVLAYVTLLRADLTMAPLALGTMMAVLAGVRAARRAFPGALPGGLAAAIVAAALGWWWFHMLRRARAGLIGVQGGDGGHGTPSP